MLAIPKFMLYVLLKGRKSGQNDKSEQSHEQ
jgi:hypothetical protein